MENKKQLIDTNYLRKYQFSSIDSIYDEGWNDAIEFIMKKAPAVDAVEVVHGRWKRARYTEAPLYICSNCDTPEYKRHNYCPNCGAKMDEKEN